MPEYDARREAEYNSWCASPAGRAELRRRKERQQDRLDRIAIRLYLKENPYNDEGVERVVFEAVRLLQTIDKVAPGLLPGKNETT